jgi:hypothetical protein
MVAVFRIEAEQWSNPGTIGVKPMGAG